MSLLDQAKKIPRKASNKWNKEHFELTEAWLKSEITLSQISRVITPKGKKSYPNVGMNMVMSCLRQMRREGLIQIVKRKEE